MRIQFSKKFEKQLTKSSPKIKKRFYERLQIFEKNPYDSQLRNHPAKGKYLGYYSIDVTGDIRALYTKRGNTIIIFGYIGSHSQLYG